MTGLSVDVDIDPSEDLFGKSVTDLQNVYLSDSGLKGTLKYVADYSSAYGSGEDSGNYAVIHAEVPGVEGVTLTVQVVGGTHGPQTLDSDGICIQQELADHQSRGEQRRLRKHYPRDQAERPDAGNGGLTGKEAPLHGEVS